MQVDIYPSKSPVILKQVTYMCVFMTGNEGGTPHITIHSHNWVQSEMLRPMIALSHKRQTFYLTFPTSVTVQSDRFSWVFSD